jgi:hypothetical protein
MDAKPLTEGHPLSIVESNINVMAQGDARDGM